MFYLKVPLANGVSIQAEIHGDNVITHCHCCGNEMQVDLADVFADGEGDLERKLTVKVNYFSKTAQEKIEAAGGRVEVI